MGKMGMVRMIECEADGIRQNRRDIEKKELREIVDYVCNHFKNARNQNNTIYII